MLAKRPTAKLRAIGIEDLIVNKCSMGYSLHNPAWERQSGIVYRTAGQAVEAARNGARPKQLDPLPKREPEPRPATYGDALTLARRKARYGHRNWIVWTDKQGQPQAEKVTPETMKRCLLDVGTKGKWMLVTADTGSLMKGFWYLGLVQISQAKRNFSLY
jgi:hypothetical protein